MSAGAVASLYDALHTFESSRRAGAYPVHKKLRFDEPGITDIYDWILARVALRDRGEILDAGCGVGFGSLRLAARTTCRVTGISLSARELTGARAAAARARLDDRVEFLDRSFDDLSSGTYDLVVAVESLKHSTDLSRSLRVIRRSLKPGGRLVIVEDFYRGDERAATAAELARDWSLGRLHSEADYLAVLGGPHCSVIDLTEHVRRTSVAAVKTKLALLGLWLQLAPEAHALALRAFRGGLHLEKLYASGKVAYKAILFRNDCVAAP